MTKFMCPNCGEEMPEYLSLKHYTFCAMSTPPEKQPYRGKDSEEVRRNKVAEWFRKKMGRALE